MLLNAQPVKCLSECAVRCCLWSVFFHPGARVTTLLCRTLGGGPTPPWGGPGGGKEGKLGHWNYIKQAARHNYVPRRALGFGVGQVPPVGPRIRTTMIWEPGLDRTVGNYKWLDVSEVLRVLRKASYNTKADDRSHHQHKLNCLVGRAHCDLVRWVNQ